MPPIKIGFIGAGGIFPAHAEGLAGLPEARIVGFYDANPETSRQRAAEHQARAFDAPEDLLAADVDAVIILTPPTFHAQYAIQALEAGKHVYCEKPLTLNVAEAEAIAAKARETGLTFQTGFNNHYIQPERGLAELYHAGELGRLVCAYDRHWIERGDSFWAMKTSQPDTWRLSWEESQGRMAEFGSHKINWLQWLGGAPHTVFGVHDVVSPTLGRVGVDDVVSAVLRFEQGYGVVEVIMAPGVLPRRDVGIIGTAGHAQARGKKIVVRANEQERELEPEPCRSRWQEFLTCIRERRQPEVDAADGLLSVRIQDAFVRSLASGQAVKLTPS